MNKNVSEDKVTKFYLKKSIQYFILFLVVAIFQTQMTVSAYANIKKLVHKVPFSKSMSKLTNDYNFWNVDYNADGFLDVWIEPKNNNIFIANKTNIVLPISSHSPWVILNTTSGAKVIFNPKADEFSKLNKTKINHIVRSSDINGDKQAEWIYLTNNTDGWIAEFSNGSFKIIRNLKALIEEDHQWSIEDANGDLFNDIVVRNKNDREISIVYGKENSSLEIQGINSSLRIQALNAVAPSVASDVQSAELPATALGGLVGQPQVAASGNFQYNIPIPIPPVEGKIQPNLQILYDSSAQVSELGIGFRLNAGSTITRCPKTRSTDGENLPVAYDSSDAFCLDGQRLLHVGGNRYIAEMGNDIIEIRAEGVLASGPTSFKVYFNNGRLATFGADANSRLIRSDGQTSSHGVSPLNPIFSWAISSMEDNFGHRVNYFYYLDTLKGIQRLSEITYDNYKILFFYKTPRWQQDYSTSDPFLTAPQVLATGGPVIRYGNLLTRVEVHGLAGLINVNHLRYDFSSQTKGDSLIKHQLAKLISIQQCSLQRCQKPTHFSWPEETAAINTRYSAWGNKYNSVNMLSVHVQHVQWGDFNGDGVNDIYYISGKRGFNDPIADQDKIYITQPDQTQVEWNGLKTFSFDAHRRLIFADFNGDGITDIYYGGNGSDYERGGDTVEVTNQNDTGKIYFSQGNGSFVIKEGPKISWANSNLRIRVGDFNGDGIQDIYHIRGAQGTVQSNAIYLFESDGSYQTVVVQGYPLSNTSEWIGEDLKGYVFADFNGDGITDLYKHNIERGAHNISGGRIDRIYQFNSSGQIGSTWDVQDIQYSMRIYDGDNPATASADLSRFKWQDFNGDGRTDVYYLEGDGSSSIDKIYISLGNGRFTVFNGITKFMPSTAPDQSVESGRYQLTDWNGDGLVDIHRLPARGQNTQTEVFLAQPFQDKWFAEAPLKTNFTFLVDGDRELARYDFSRLQYVDFNADGRSDIYETRRWESLNLYNMAHIATASPRLISAITNSSNSKLEVNYSALTTKKNYIFEAKANSYPFRHTLFPLFTVSSFKNDNGMGGQQEYQYAYEKSLSHIDYGWLGFGKIIQTNNIELQNHSSITGEPSITKVKEINTTNYIQDPVQRLTGSVQETSRSVGGVNIQRAYFEYQTQNNLVNGLKQFFPKTTRSQTATWDLKGFFTGNNQKIWTYDLNKLISQNECNIGANPANIQIIIPCLNTTIWIKNISTNHEYLLDFARAYSDGTSLVDNSLIAKTSVIKRANSAYTSEHSLPWPAHALMKHQENTLYQYQAGTGLLNNLTTTDGLDVMQTKTVFAYSPKGFLLQKKQLGVDFPVRNLYFSYDEQSRLTKQTNALGHETFQYYEDARFPWKVTSSTDVNGLKAYSAYDDFGAVKQTTNALGIITTVEQDFCSAGCQAGEVSWKKTQSIGVPTQWEWFDAFDRVVRKQSSGWLGLIESRTLYNPEGHVAAQSTPRYLNEPELFKTINYDALDRIVQERTSNGSIQTQNYTGLQTEMFDANWHAAGGLAFPSATQYMDPQGLLLKVVDASGADIQYAYDVRGLNARTQLTSNLIIDNFYNWAGHKIKSQHPDQGTWIYSYDALGQMQSQTDSKQQKQSFTYDVLGRTLTHTTSEGITKWIYDAGENAKGQTVRTEHPNVIRQFYYDNFSRVSRTQTTIGQNTYNQSTVYDTFGRVQRINYPNSLSIGFQYDPNLGYLIRKDNLTEARSVWKLKEMDAQGRVTQNSLGNGVWITNYYDPHTGYLIGNKSVLGTQIKTYFDYSYDRVGNLIERHDNQQSTSEYFHYDNLNRLKQSQTDSSGIIHTVKLTYNALGNIITKSDVGNYSYGVAQNTSTQVRTDCFGGPHAAIKIADKPFCYDANGNLTQDDQRTLQFNSENLSTSIRHTNGNASQLIYGPGKELVVRRDTDPMGAQTEVIYLGDVEIIKKSSLSDQYRYRVGSEVALTSNANSPTTIQSKFQILDHLESVIAILDINGNIENKYSYDAWGKRRNINWQPSSNILYGNWITAAGFTGHEHLDAIGLIHMNGRIYNPTIGRFVSADPVIQAPTDLQSYNGYAYARNNPLKFTDPTGYSWLSKQWNKFTNFLDKHWKTIIIVGVTFMVGGLAATSFGAAGYGKILTGALVAGISSFTANIIGGLLHGANMIDSFKAGFSSVPKAMAMGAVISATLEAIYRAVTPHINQEVELYDITNKKPIKLDPTTINNESAVIFASGQNNSLEYAAGLAKTYTNNQATHLIYNPTVSGFADTVESVLEKLTGRGPGSESFANNLKGFNLKNSTLYVHSQAGITSRNALMLLHTQGVDVAGLKVSMHGAAVNKISTQILFNRMDVNMIGFNAHALDAVPNILGYNALTIPNPYRLVGSILASPLLFKGGEWSPHTNPGGGKNLNMFPSWY